MEKSLKKCPYCLCQFCVVIPVPWFSLYPLLYKLSKYNISNPELLHPEVSQVLKSPGHRGEKPWSLFQLAWPHWRDHGVDLPSPALPHLALRTPAYFSRRDLSLFEKDGASAASVTTVPSPGGSQLGVGLSCSFLDEKKEQANYQTSYLICVDEI